MKILITADFSLTINDFVYYFKVNEDYDFVEEHKEVLVDGEIKFYNVAMIDGDEVNLPHEDTCVINDKDVPEFKGMNDAFLSLQDSTTDYLEAYDELLGIVPNPYCDVAAGAYYDPDENEE